MIEKVEFRKRAKAHLSVAKAALQSGMDDDVLVAALRLRMSLECLAYELLQSLQNDVDNLDLADWRPARLIRELKEIDPEIEKDRSLSIGFTKQTEEEPALMHDLGTDSRLSARFISKSWHALSQLLHEPTIQDRKKQANQNSDKRRQKVTTVCNELDRVLSSTLYGTNFRAHFKFNCECGYPVVRREENLNMGKPFVCANCKLQFRAFEKDGEWRLSRVFWDFKCEACGETSEIRARERSEGDKIMCSACGQEHLWKFDWVAVIDPS